MSEQLEHNIVGIRWNDIVSVVLFTVMFYEYSLLFDKELKYVWNRPWSLMSCLYLVVRYLGLFLSITWGCWGGMFYIAESPYVTISLFHSQVPRLLTSFIQLLRHSCCTGMGCVCVFLLCGSYSHLASLRTMQGIETPTLCLCCSRVVLAYRRPFDRHRHLSV